MKAELQQSPTRTAAKAPTTARTAWLKKGPKDASADPARARLPLGLGGVTRRSQPIDAMRSDAMRCDVMRCGPLRMVRIANSTRPCEPIVPKRPNAHRRASRTQPIDPSDLHARYPTVHRSLGRLSNTIHHHPIPPPAAYHSRTPHFRRILPTATNTLLVVQYDVSRRQEDLGGLPLLRLPSTDLDSRRSPRALRLRGHPCLESLAGRRSFGELARGLPLQHLWATLGLRIPVQRSARWGPAMLLRDLSLRPRSMARICFIPRVGPHPTTSGRRLLVVPWSRGRSRAVRGARLHAPSHHTQQHVPSTPRRSAGAHPRFPGRRLTSR